MNYDKIAAMKVNELRMNVRVNRNLYNEVMGTSITAKEIRYMPKARLLFIVCHYWACQDARNKYDRMEEELKHRAAVMAEKEINPPMYFGKMKFPKKFTITVEEVPE